MPRVLRSLLVPLLALGPSACMTFDTRTNPGYDGPRVYSGVREDLSLMRNAFLSLDLPILVLFTLDLPLCLAADTALLPLTMAEGRDRGPERHAALGSDVDVPGPAQPLPGAPNQENARRLFETCAARFEALDSSAADCFAVDARVVSGDEREQSGARYKLELEHALAQLRESGGFASYRDPSFTLEGERVRIDVTLFASFLGRPTRASFVVAPGADGDWRIIEANVPAWPD